MGIKIIQTLLRNKQNKPNGKELWIVIMYLDNCANAWNKSSHEKHVGEKVEPNLEFNSIVQSNEAQSFPEKYCVNW